MGEWTHDGLADDLADHLRRPERMMWLDMQAGPAGSPRPDVLTMAKSFVRPRPLVYEVKVSRADYFRDTNAEKWRGYLQYAQGVYFAVPRGLIKRDELPPHAGLIVRGETWHTIKAPTLSPLGNMSQDFLLKLLIDGVDRLRADTRLKDFDKHAANQRIRGQLGDTVADVLKDIEEARTNVRSWEERATAHADGIELREQASREALEEERERARHTWAEIGDVLGCKPDQWSVDRAIRSLRDGSFADAEKRELHDLITAATQALSRICTMTGLETEEEERR